MIRICEFCGEEVSITPSRGGAEMIFCNMDCKHNYYRENKKTRREIREKYNNKPSTKIKKRLWHEYKFFGGKTSLVSDDVCCESCGRNADEVQLVIHHVNGNHNDNSEGNHQILCRSCHAYHHGIIRGGLNKGGRFQGAE